MYAVASQTAGCSITQNGVTITIDGTSGLFAATASECTVSHPDAIVQFIF